MPTSRTPRTCLPILIALFLTGCGLKAGQTHIGYIKDTVPPRMSNAPVAGDYALYTFTTAKPDLHETLPAPRVVQHLKEGQRIGFMTTDIGAIRAVAGPYYVDLAAATARAEWRLHKKD